MQKTTFIDNRIADFMDAIIREWAPNRPTLASLGRRLYKDTDAGITISYQFDDGSYSWSAPHLDLNNPGLVSRVRCIGFSSIVEGTDQEVPLQWLDLLDDQWVTAADAVTEFNRLAAETNDEACRAWNEAHAFYFA